MSDENRKKAEEWLADCIKYPVFPAVISSLTALLDSVQAEGAKEEREKVVRWLQAGQDAGLAYYIEQGEHLK